ncbi:MAG: C40 family peptidase [Bacteroidota bacterium]
MNSVSKVFLFFVVILFATACTSRNDRNIAGLNTLLDSLKSQYAPDSRIELWDLTVAAEEGSIYLAGEVANKGTYKAIVKAVDENFPEVKNTMVLLPVDGTGQLVTGLVNNSVIHLRHEPSSKKELVTQARLGTPVRILKDMDGKRLIQTPDGYLGWVNIPEVQAIDLEELTRYRESQKIVYQAQYGSSYSEPDETSMPVADLVIGCILPVVSQESGFLEVEYPDGRLAWVKKSEVIDAEEVFYKTVTKENVEKTILEFHGIPYLWGGASSKAIDCSGLVSNVFFMNGIQLPRDASQQIHCGRVMTEDFDPEGLETGDLLFFGRKATDSQPERVTHVATYLGDTEFIHAAGYRERVSINSMDSTRANFIDGYPEIFIRAVRIIGEEGEGFGPIAENEFFKEIIHIAK